MERQANDPAARTGSEKSRPAFTRGQLWLLAGVLAVGVLWEFAWESDGTTLWLGAFWLGAMAVFVLCNPGRIAGNRAAIFVGIPAALLCVGLIAGYIDEQIADLLGPALPAVMMTFAVLATQDVPVGREGTAVVGVLKGVFVKPFTGIPVFFRAIAALFRGRDSTARRVGYGLLAGIPLTVIVLALLASADARMGQLLGALFDRFDVGVWAMRVGMVFAAAMLFYSLFYNMTWGRRDPLMREADRDWALAGPAVVMALLLTAYAVFGYIQFSYLFGGTLPVDLTYSEYAREGFGQLIAVTIINFTVLGVCFVKVRPSGALRALETLLLLASAVVLASAAWRLLLYVGAYGLTILRVLGLWLMEYLAFLAVMAAVRVFRERTKLLRIGAYALLYWYLALNAVPWSAAMAAFNAAFGH